MLETLEEYDEILTAAGYREFAKPSMLSPNAAAFYQKRISDETGLMRSLDRNDWVLEGWKAIA